MLWLQVPRHSRSQPPRARCSKVICAAGKVCFRRASTWKWWRKKSTKVIFWDFFSGDFRPLQNSSKKRGMNADSRGIGFLEQRMQYQIIKKYNISHTYIFYQYNIINNAACCGCDTQMGIPTKSNVFVQIKRWPATMQGIHFHGPIVWSFLVDLMFSIHVNPVFFIAKFYQESCHLHPFPIHFLTESHINLNSVIWNPPAMASCIGVASLDRLYSNLHRRSCFRHRLGSCWPFGRSIWKCSSSWFAVQQLQKTKVLKRPIVRRCNKIKQKS